MVVAEPQRGSHLLSVRRMAGLLGCLSEEAFVGVVWPMASNDIPVGKTTRRKTLSYLFGQQRHFVEGNEE
jgi:hypothetical protein